MTKERIPIRQKLSQSSFLFALSIVCGVSIGWMDISVLNQVNLVLSEVFIKIFKCLSLPLISLSMIVTITRYHTQLKMKNLGKRTLLYTFGTTIVAACVACLTYLVVRPSFPHLTLEGMTPLGTPSPIKNAGYLNHILQLVPSHFFEPFLNHQVLGVLLISVALGFAIRTIADPGQQKTISEFFHGFYSIFITLTRWLIKIIPIALYSFIAVLTTQFKEGLDLKGLGQYLLVILLANLIQGLVVLPLWLRWNSLSPLRAMKGMMPALSLAFFSKSSAGTLPVTMECAEKRLKVRAQVSQFVLPLCTTINMNGCAAFIFTTVIYLLQGNGTEITVFTLVSWIGIATLAAIGNAGVPMGCFFLSASLLSSMDIPLAILGLILPFYSVIDMVETALNVWSDSCVALVVDKNYSLST